MTERTPRSDRPEPKPSKPASERAEPPQLESPSPDPRSTREEVAVPPRIVGLGASAGGLEALEAFLHEVPTDCDAAFVVVQHLDPERKGFLVELLQRKTPMEVVEVRDRMPVRPRTVFVIPPNRDLSVFDGVLHLLGPVAPRGMRMPIDFFLRTLAADQRERSIAVILSGMGSDGSLGLRAIKEVAGVAMVQDPTSAGFDGMPRSAIEAGLADVVATPRELAREVCESLRRPPAGVQRDSVLEQSRTGELEKILVLLRAQTSQDFTHYKKSTLYRRIDRRMRLHRLEHLGDYVRHLRENPGEADLLFQELLISVTSFFRDPQVWDQLRDEHLPPLLESRPNGSTLRAWVAGCSTGEEAYSVAIVLEEALARLAGRHLSVQIFATDLDRAAVERARAGVYPANIAADVGAERLRRFFVEEGDSYRVCKEIRKNVIFAAQNLLMDPPFTRLDLLVCRNLLIYLTPAIQQRLLPLFHYCLRPGGLLVLGTAETVGGASALFRPLSSKARIYRRNETPDRVEKVDFPAAFSRRDPVETAVGTPSPPAANLQAQVEALLVQRFTPPAVLVSQQGDILYVSGKTGRFLEPAAGNASWNIFSMAREGLRLPLESAFHRAVLGGHQIDLPAVTVRSDGAARTVEVTVQPLDHPEALRGRLLIAFREVAAPRAVDAGDLAPTSGAAPPPRNPDAEHRLRESEEELRVLREEMQASQEELRSANEELQSANEELQSANEELTSSKEEMQSMNEELQTVNQELKAKLEELSRASDDMKNLLESTSVATLFLDEDLQVRRYTSEMTKIIKLIPSDVGRPITDLVSALDYADLADDVREVLRTLVFKETDVPTGDGRWYKTRIMPYRTRTNRIEGVVITFADISEAKRLEHRLRDHDPPAPPREPRGPER